jgi:hypothetical protein
MLFLIHNVDHSAIQQIVRRKKGSTALHRIRVGHACMVLMRLGVTWYHFLYAALLPTLPLVRLSIVIRAILATSRINAGTVFLITCQLTHPTTTHLAEQIAPSHPTLLATSCGIKRVVMSKIHQIPADLASSLWCLRIQLHIHKTIVRV